MAQETVSADLSVPRWRMTRALYDALVGTGALEGEPVELLEGVLVEVVPQGPEHADVIQVLTQHLVRSLPDPWLLRVQLPLAATTASEPEPDLAVTRRTPGEHPSTAALVIEVAGTTQRTDLVHKPPVYAEAGVEQYWVLDLPRREVVVHTEPGEAGYATVRRLPWTAPLAALGVPVDLATLLADV
ncbi:Uma2 family endonuclease [Quadrisphaera sp. DSM 44207]|uniref:Uma2 family endonuclease n=1 Tax=Quadrisphaera sp. DSM 44207 TaxID=1881057 RepID=UPI000887D7B9|nr:Uma2 family endonuclease [Quadrisphaera sp. DSM 44207]SDQ48133.1 Endonuclease, Uma2 family (restriction endonuclease fold) [Quadrisphaera sp. DSM 44207]